MALGVAIAWVLRLMDVGTVLLVLLHVGGYGKAAATDEADD